MCVCVIQRDEIQLYVKILIPIRLFVSVSIHMCVWGLLSLAALTNIQHRRCTNPEFMREGEQSSKEAGAPEWSKK